MDIKSIKTGKVNYLEKLDADLYWGTDFAGGDLYEAEEVYKMQGHANSNRLIFVSMKDGKVFEPAAAGPGQYFGRPVAFEGRIYLLLVDFAEKKINILVCAEDLSSASVHASLSLNEVPDCYNLMLDTAPLTLVRQGAENKFQVVWPEKGEFAIEPSESFDFRDQDTLVFSKWFEDPDYREVTILRKYPSGEVIEELPGPVMTSEDGQRWLLSQE